MLLHVHGRARFCRCCSGAMTEARDLVYKDNRRGPVIEPWGDSGVKAAGSGQGAIPVGSEPG